MTLIDDTLKVAKKTHIEGIRWWLKRRHRGMECPVTFKDCDTPDRHPVCSTLFPKVREHRCPCGDYGLKYVTRRARELVKAWEEKR